MSMTDRKAVRRWESSGLKCAAIDSEIGFINGYVQLPPEHFAHDFGYDQLNRAIRIHGGLTYGTDEDGWVGFDTGHAGDYWPGMDERRFFGPTERVWSMERLVAEVEGLAAQLSALTEIPDPESSRECTEDEFQALLRDAKSWRATRAVYEALRAIRAEDRA